jgi:short-subunit dehydrogenase involved in D-alanine esterification of teichoic acids
VSGILKSHPTLDTVFINAGIQKSFSMLDVSSSTPSSITAEIDSNLTAPILLTRLLLPHLVSLAQAGHPAALLTTSSSLAYVPLGFYPAYCATKAGMHAFLVAVRAQVGAAPEVVRRNLSVVEIVPPYVDTRLDAAHRAEIVAMQGGEDKAFPAMPLEEYIEKVFAGLDEVDAEGRMKKEIGVGFGQVGIDTWRGSFGKILEDMGIDS